MGTEGKGQASFTSAKKKPIITGSVEKKNGATRGKTGNRSIGAEKNALILRTFRSGGEDADTKQDGKGKGEDLGGYVKFFNRVSYQSVERKKRIRCISKRGTRHRGPTNS